MGEHGPLFVSADTVRSVFQWTEGIHSLQLAYGAASDLLSAPPRSIAQSGGAWLRSLSAAPPGGRYYGAKLMGMAMASARPGVEYVVVLFDRETSRIAAFLDGNALTGCRTAATSAAALDGLAPEGPARLGIVGSGLEAAMHARAFSTVRDLTGVKVFSPSAERREAFADALSRDIGIAVEPVPTAEAAVGDADLVLAAARSRGEVPTLYADWLKPRATLVSVGSTIPQQREIDVSVAEKADLIICDNVPEVLNETGDMIAARAAGIDVSAKMHSLSALMKGELGDLLRSASMPMFKSVGGGLQDIVIAELVLERAIAAGLATELHMHFETKI